MSSTISISRWLLATALVPVSHIRMHPSQRSVNEDQVKSIFEELQHGITHKEAQKVILLLPPNWSPNDLKTQLDDQTSPSDVLRVPDGVSLICIDGQHRIEATRRHIRDLQNANRTTIPEEESCWWAEIYSGDLDSSIVVKAWMVERNQITTQLPSSFYDQLVALRELLQRDPLRCRTMENHPASSFLKGDAMAMTRLLRSCLADSLMLYASFPCYVHLTSAICRSWNREPLLFQFIDFVLKDAADQIRRLEKKSMGSGVTPASFSPSDLHPSLTGDQSELKQLWDSKGSPMREDFDFSDFDDFLASLALPPMTGDGEDRPPLIGLRMVFPAALNLTKNRDPGNISGWLQRCNAAMHQMHFLFTAGKILPPVETSHQRMQGQSSSWLDVSAWGEVSYVTQTQNPQDGIHGAILEIERVIARLAFSLVDEGDVGSKFSKKAWEARSTLATEERKLPKKRVKDKKSRPAVLQEQEKQARLLAFEEGLYKSMFWSGLLDQERFDTWNSLLLDLEADLQRKYIPLKRDEHLWKTLEDWRTEEAQVLQEEPDQESESLLTGVVEEDEEDEDRGNEEEEEEDEEYGARKNRKKGKNKKGTRKGTRKGKGKGKKTGEEEPVPADTVVAGSNDLGSGGAVGEGLPGGDNDPDMGGFGSHSRGGSPGGGTEEDLVVSNNKDSHGRHNVTGLESTIPAALYGHGDSTPANQELLPHPSTPATQEPVPHPSTPTNQELVPDPSTPANQELVPDPAQQHSEAEAGIQRDGNPLEELGGSRDKTADPVTPPSLALTLHQASAANRENPLQPLSGAPPGLAGTKRKHLEDEEDQEMVPPDETQPATQRRRLDDEVNYVPVPSTYAPPPPPQPAPLMTSLQYAEEAVRLLKSSTLRPRDEQLLAPQLKSLLGIVRKSIESSQRIGGSGTSG